MLPGVWGTEELVLDTSLELSLPAAEYRQGYNRNGRTTIQVFAVAQAWAPWRDLGLGQFLKGTLSKRCPQQKGGLLEARSLRDSHDCLAG